MFQRLTEDVRYQGPFLTVVGGRFSSPSGEEFEREYLKHPGAVAVVALDDDGRFILVRQYRAAVDRQLLEIPAGLLDVDGEDPEDAARRELEEEIGRIATGSLERLVTYLPAAGMADHQVAIYLCRSSTPCEVRPHGPEESAMTTEAVAIDDIDGLVAEGEVSDGKTIVGLLLAKARLT